jgi:PelA/Pel-15E family pectate lyase
MTNLSIKLGTLSLALGLAFNAQAQYSPISIDGFSDGIKHYRDKSGRDDYPRYQLSDIVSIGDNLLVWQRSNGGWPPNQDPLRILSALERTEQTAKRQEADTSFDNRNTYSQIQYLAAVYTQTQQDQFRQAAVRGLEFLLSAQYPNGGWPHSFPRDSSYYPHITVADDVMTGILATLRTIVEGETTFAWLDKELRTRIENSLSLGDACLLQMQIKVGNELTAWAGQYDRHTLQPIMGRTYELPSIVSSESVSVVRYLMSIQEPTPAVIHAIDSAVRWFERSALQGIRIEKVAAEPVRYENHTSTYDLVVVQDSTAPPIWARFYDIETNRPFMANRDGNKVYSLAEVERERRTGYGWYSGAPNALLQNDFPSWQSRMAARASQAQPPGPGE